MRNARRGILAITLVLTACGGEHATIAVNQSAAAVGSVVPIFIASNRAVDSQTMEFTSARSEQLTFGRFDVSVPPDREKGEIHYPKPSEKQDPTKDFLTVSRVLQSDEKDFRTGLATALQQKAPGNRDTVIYVHGFNNSFADGLYRLSQLSHDLSLPGVPVYFSWPSRAKPLGYVADRDSAAISRDGLETLIREVEAAGSENIILVAHSMGCLLTMEALRQMGIRGDRRTLDRIGGVVLLSPDIDVDFFRSQTRSIQPLPQPFLIYGSAEDKILSLSAKLTGQHDRLGNLKDVKRLSDLDVTYIDVTAFTKGSNHFVAGDNPVLIGLLEKMMDVNRAMDKDVNKSPAAKPAPVRSAKVTTKTEETSFVMFDIAREIVLTPTTPPLPLFPNDDR